MPPYDIAAALSKDGAKLTVSVINPTSEAIQVKLALGTTVPTGTATRRHITGPKAESHNAPGKPRVVDIQTKDGIDATAPLEIPALSTVLFEIPIR